MTVGDYEKVRAATLAGNAELSAEQVLAALALLHELREELAGWEPQLIAAARELGASWARLAPVLGVASRQAAERRYLRLRPSELAETGEQRVRAERDKRAGDRAVSLWARENAALLRTVAAQVGMVDVGVRTALAGDDAAALVQPLTWALERLHGTHPALAEQICLITARADQVRRDTQFRRDGQT
ncbi:MAG: HSP18 transcriptional regulator [Kutzneria sp.]|nr:HSP18 transcriptional regulator [Kutzneria sp.]MBV9844353.1 HSP18 transcriptional regulator [Kutzneria sp.]